MIGLAKTAEGPGNLELIERCEPSAASGQVVLEVIAAGVCGTDLHIESGEFACHPTVTLGHEVSGRVVEVGAEVDPEWLGARVVSETFFATCERCMWCREGRPNLCPDRRSIGVHVDGAFASHLVVPARNLHRIPDWLDARAAAMMEPLACVCQAVCDPAQVEAGDRVLVTGPGPVGLLSAQVADALGGSVTVVGLARDRERLSVALSLGFETAEIDDAALGDIDVVIESSGSGAAAALGMNAVRRGGRYVQVGIFGKDITIPFDLMLYKEIAFATGFASTPRSWRRALALVSGREVELSPLLSEVARLSEWQRVFQDLRTGRGMKIALDPRLAADPHETDASEDPTAGSLNRTQAERL